MPYAGNGQISSAPIDGGIAITRTQYHDALNAKLSGDEVRVVDGAMEIYTPSSDVTAYWVAPAEKHYTDPGEEPPDGAVTTEPPDDNHVIDGGQWVYSLERERESMSITQYQARAALNNAGLLPDVEALMDDPATDTDIKLQWKHKSRIRRTHSATTSMASALGWSDTQLDDLFRAAMQLEE